MTGLVNAWLMEGWTAHSPHHWSRMLRGQRMDYWPTRGRWRWNGQTRLESPWFTGAFIREQEALGPLPDDAVLVEEPPHA